MTHKQQAFETLAGELIKNLEKRGMEGYYFDNSPALLSHLRETLPADSVISWGGSESVKESGVMDLLHKGGYKLIDRADAKTPEEDRQLFSQAVMADYYFMSSNAVTLNGELVNIDGNGNRVACLIHGPSHVMLVVGRNKITACVEDAVRRVRNTASPANAKRLGCQTPCNFKGSCGDCLSPDCMCSHIVVTRRCRSKGRIKVLLVNEELGY